VLCTPPSLRVATAETICGSSGSATAIAPLLPDGLSGFGWRTPRVGPVGGRSGPPHGGGDPPAGIEMSFSPNRFGPRASQDGSAWRIRRKNLENTYAPRSKTSAYTRPPSRYKGTPIGVWMLGVRWEVELGAWDLTLLDHQDSPLALAGNAIGNRQREGRVSGRVAGDIDPVCLAPPAIDQHFADPGWPW